MEIRERRSGSVVILDLEGKILLGEGDIQLKEYIAKLVERGERKVMLNMAGVPYMDSSGLGEIVRCYTAVRRAPGGGELKLYNLTKRLQDLLTITKLISVFETHANEESALQSFSAE
ncbi:MAG: STAS domain-containing protein [Blastocatellia bacterium]|nr:STAS domain-containing protein [Blastocatellia bacterium]